MLMEWGSHNTIANCLEGQEDPMPVHPTSSHDGTLIWQHEDSDEVLRTGDAETLKGKWRESFLLCIVQKY